MLRIAAIVLATSLATSSAFAAKDPCKGVKVVKNAFGTERVYDGGDFKLKKTANGWTFTVKFTAGGGYGAFASTTTEQIPEGTTVEVLMADDTTVQLTTSSNAGPQQAYTMGIVSNWYELPFGVSADQIQAFVGQDIKAARVMKGNDASLVKEIKPKDYKGFKETAACMLAN